MAVKVSEQGERAWWERVMVPLLEEATVPVEIVRNADHQQKLAVLVGARALLCPLRWDEPFGLMMVEAGACGTPVVAWDRGAVSEVVDDGRSGFVVAPGDVDGLCDAVERADEIDRRAARDRVEQHFSAWRMLHDHQRLYRRVLAAHAASRDSASAFTARTEDTVLRIPEAGRAAGRR
jgi:glycosyltransferase involved in cell wall biosynthesis